METKYFFSLKETTKKCFKSKLRTIISKYQSSFNLINVSMEGDGRLSIYKWDKISKLEIPIDQTGSTSHRAMTQYIYINYRPDICANVQLVAPRSSLSTKESFTVMKKVVKKTPIHSVWKLGIITTLHEKYKSRPSYRCIVRQCEG